MRELAVGTGHWRARQKYPVIGNCERCVEKPATDRHHKDGNTLNNDRSNVAFLCRKCHMEEDGRMETLNNLPRPKHAPKPCANCGGLTHALRKRRCHKCNEYFRRNGIEWTPEGDHRFGKRAPDHYCDNCKRLVVSGWSKGRCPTCRLYKTAHGIERPIK